MHVSYLLMLMEFCVNSACEISASVAFLARKAAAFSQQTADCKCQKSVAFNTVYALPCGAFYTAQYCFCFVCRI